MTQLKRIASILLLLFITACTIILPSPIVIIRDAQATDTSSPSPSPTVTTIPTVTATPSPTAIVSLSAVTTANVNFRIAPNTNNTPILVVLTGTRVTLVGRNSDASWLRTILSDGRQGWMFWQNLTISGNRFDLPVVTVQATATPPIDPTPTREVGTRGLNWISYNINGETVPDENYLFSVLTSPCKTTALVMNNLHLAVTIKQRCPSTIVIHRDYSSLEGDEWFYRSPQNFVDHWKRQGHPEIVRYSTNEPSFGGVRTAQFVNTEIELMRLMREAGFTCACGNFSVGIIQAHDINAGAFDSYIRGLNLYGHFLALHEYACCALPFGVGQWGAALLLDRMNVQPASWPSIHAVPMRLWNGELPPYWYLRRGDWWLLRADAIGVARPRIILTEFGWDGLPDIKPIIEPLRLRFGIDRYFRDMRGINTYQNLWAYYWPQWTFAQAACEQLKWAIMIYPPEYIGADAFAWNTNPHWLQTDFSGRENPQLFELHQCLRG